MGNIQPEINAFKAAEEGEDVRDAIVSLANKLNAIVEQVVVETSSDIIVGYKDIRPADYNNLLANINIAAVFPAEAGDWADAPTTNAFTIINTKRSARYNLQIAYGLAGKPNFYWRMVNRDTHEVFFDWVTDDTPIDTTLSVSGAAADAETVGDALDGIRNTFDSYVYAVNAAVFTSLSLNRKANTTVGQNSVALGVDNEASGYGSFAEGGYTKATKHYAHSEGLETNAAGENSHAEGKQTTAGGKQAHAEGNHSGASGDNSHAEGNNTIAYGGNSHTEGSDTFAQGVNSHAEGIGTGALSDNQHVHGKYNVNDQNGTYVSIVGNGTNSSSRSNAATLDWSGNAWFAGTVKVGTGDKELATKEYVDSVSPFVDVSIEFSNGVASGTYEGSISGASLQSAINSGKIPIFELVYSIVSPDPSDSSVVVSRKCMATIVDKANNKATVMYDYDGSVYLVTISWANSSSTNYTLALTALATAADISNAIGGSY